jgi:hypothetical protein
MKPDRRPEPLRGFVVIACFSTLVFLPACQSDRPANVYAAPVDGLAVARSAQVPTPATTPFDATPQQRTEYVNAYQDGYRSGLTGMSILFRKPSDTVQTARVRGWRDGADAGLKEYFYRKKKR